MTALPTTVTDEMDTELGHDGLVELTYAIAVRTTGGRGAWQLWPTISRRSASARRLPFTVPHSPVTGSIQ